MKAAKGTPRFAKRREIRVVVCTDLFVQVRKPVGLLVLSAMSLSTPVDAPDPDAHERDHFLCDPAATPVTGTPIMGSRSTTTSAA